ncbi:glycoside hydrolase family 15 protein [Paenibacillus daejeonensis]|uniref:glycoside hydrolase family 15 protein n=1 Tax=Paenibacillus daejeonensis TaxID=135193 RepID=UPI00037A6A4C|nr:glycoside hydrolase family 15 protein [Paenibacillus daejeonensis]
MLTDSYAVLNKLCLPHGLYIASPSQDYRYVWIRDSIYMSLPHLDKTTQAYEKTFYRLFDLFLDYEWKLDWIAMQRPHHPWEYLHARYSHDQVKEVHHEEWGHIQHDTIGAFLFGVGAGLKRGKTMLRDGRDARMVQKLVHYLEHVRYWEDADNGMWEEWREIHASSVGACVAGLKAVERIAAVPQGLVEKGLRTLLELFPAESKDKPVDLAQLSLIYPYRLFSGVMAETIVNAVEQRLLRERGVIRYEGDSYYSTLEAEHGRGQPLAFYEGTEAEWTFGLPWLALCHLELGNPEEARRYIRWSEDVMTEPGCLPELYYQGSATPNVNTPLGWSSAMYILAKEAELASERSAQHLA